MSLKNAFHILKTDIKNIIKNPAALIVIAAVTFLPSLYAWLNIAASWDPYENTQGVSVAVVSLDEGATIQNKEIDVGDNVIVSLAQNEDLGWQFVSKDEAVQGVEHGDYYAAIIIPEDFSEKLLSVTSDEIEKPKIDYYINEKINAISPKVTNSGASAIVENIQSTFVEEANKSIMEIFNELGLGLEKNYINIEKVRDSIFLLEEEIPDIYASLQKADLTLDVLDQSVNKVNQSLNKVDEIDEKVLDLNNQLVSRLQNHETKIDDTMDTIINQLEQTQATFGDIPKITNRLSDKGEDIDRLIGSLHDRQTSIDQVSSRIEEIYDYLKEQDEQLKNASKIKDIQDSLQESTENLDQLQQNIQQIIQDLKAGKHPAVSVIESVEIQLNEMNHNINDLLGSYEAFLFPKIDITVEQLEAFSFGLDKRINRMSARNEEAISAVHYLQKEGQSLNAPAVQDQLDLITFNIEENLDSVQSMIRVLTIANIRNEKEYISQSLEQLTAMKQSLELAQGVTAKANEGALNGQEPNKDMLSELEKHLQTTQSLLNETGELLKQSKVRDTITTTAEHLKDLKKQTEERIERVSNIQENMDQLVNQLRHSAENPESSINVLEKLLQRVNEGINDIDSIQNRLQNIQSFIDSDMITNEIERMKLIQERLQGVNETIDDVADSLSNSKKRGGDILTNMDKKALEMEQSVGSIIQFIDNDLRAKYKSASKNAEKTLNNVSEVLTEVHDKVPVVREALVKGSDMIESGRDKLGVVNEYFPKARDTIETLAEKIRDLEKKGNIDELIDLLKNDPEKISQFLADPIILDEHRLYPIPNYGSAMNPFYTTLALWVGGLILVSSLKVDVDHKERFRSYETYIGRLFTFGGIAIVQAFIVTLGDLFVMKTFVANPVAFVLFGMFISAAFVTMIYTLVSVFGNTGKVIAIIFMVMQLGGSGGTFPIQMAPQFFQKIHAFLPFTHAIGLLREAVGGIIWEIALLKILYLGIYIVLFLILGIGFKQFFNRSSDKFMEKARKSKLVI